MSSIDGLSTIYSFFSVDIPHQIGHESYIDQSDADEIGQYILYYIAPDTNQFLNN